MSWAFALLIAVLGLGAACAAVLGAFALAWDVSRTKFKKQLHGITARHEAALLAAAGGGVSTTGSKAARRSGPTGAAPGESSGGAAAGNPSASGCPGVAAIYESFTLGWLNVLVQHLWLPVLEKFVSTIAAERLQIILNEVLRKAGNKGFWKIFKSVAVEEVTFGLAPPQFQFCTAKYDPSRSYLLLIMDVHYHSSGMQAVLSPRVQLGGLPPFNARFEIVQLRLVGKLHLGLHLTKEPPGIKGIDYSFATPPEFDIQASPVGYFNLLGELPVLTHGLRPLLQQVINKRLVEPQRRYLDLQRIYRNKHVQRVGGPGGCLRVCVIGGRNLMRPPPPSSAAAAPSMGQAAAPATIAANAAGGSHGTNAVPPADGTTITDCDPYVEMRFGREVFRTPIAHLTADPVFNWQFDLRLQADLESGGGVTAAAGSARQKPSPVMLYFRVLNARTLGEPEVLSHGVLDANMLGLQANGEALPKLLELSAGPAGVVVGGGQWPRGTLSLQMSWLKAHPKRASPFPQDALRAAEGVEARMPAAAVTTATAAAAAASRNVTDPMVIGSAPAAAFDFLTTRALEIAGSAPVYGTSVTALAAAAAAASNEISPFVSSHPHHHQQHHNITTSSMKTTAPLCCAPHASLDDGSVVGCQHSRTAQEASAVRFGTLRRSLECKSWQGLEADSNTSFLGGGRRGAVHNGIHVTADGSSCMGATDSGVTHLATSVPAVHLLSLGNTTEAGSGIGVASSRLSTTMPTVLRKHKKKHGFRLGSVGGGGGAGTMSSGGGGTGGGTGARSNPFNAFLGGGRTALEDEANEGYKKPARALTGLLGFGGWRRRFSQGSNLVVPAQDAVMGGEETDASQNISQLLARVPVAAAQRLQTPGAASEAPPSGAVMVATSVAASFTSAARVSIDAQPLRIPNGGATPEYAVEAASGVGSCASGSSSRSTGLLGSSTPIDNGTEDLPYNNNKNTHAALSPPKPRTSASPHRGANGVLENRRGDGGSDTAAHQGRAKMKSCAAVEMGSGGEAALFTCLEDTLDSQLRQVSQSPHTEVELAAVEDEHQAPITPPQLLPVPHRNVCQFPVPFLPTSEWKAEPCGLTGIPPQRTPQEEVAGEIPRRTSTSLAIAPAASAAAAAALSTCPSTTPSSTPSASAADSTLLPCSSLLLPQLPAAPKQPQLSNCSSRNSAFTTAAAAAAAVVAATGENSLSYLAGSSVLISSFTGNGGGSFGRQLQSEISAPSIASSSVQRTTTGGGALLSSASTSTASAAVATTSTPAPTGCGASVTHCSSTFQSLVQVVRMQRQLQAERQAYSELYERLSEMTRKYDAMVKIRHFNNHRALVEGARFQLHLAKGVRRVVMWYNEARGVVQVEPDVGIVGGGGSGDRAQERATASLPELWPRTFSPLELEHTERGCGGFHNPSAWEGVMAALTGRSRPVPDPLRCFSLHLKSGRYLQLQLPPSGNGRSRDEWMDALADLTLRSNLEGARKERGSSLALPNGLCEVSKPTAAAAATAATIPIPAAATASTLAAQTLAYGDGGIAALAVDAQ